mgnify:CR=1 FL=1
MKRHISKILLIIPLILWGCTEEVDTSTRYVFKEHTAVSYLQEFPETYSTYLDLLYKVPVSNISHTTVGQLLSARGQYTVFAPTNGAIQSYLDSLVLQGLISTPSWEAFTDSNKLDSIRKVIVLNSIVDHGDNQECYYTHNFPVRSGSEFSLSNMLDNRLTIYYSDAPDSMYINRDCPINARNRDIYVLNGVIHQMEKVIAPKNITAAVFLQDIIENQAGPYLVMARAIQACGLMDTLKAVRDEVYEDLYQKGLIPDIPHLSRLGYVHGEGVTAKAPEHRKYGFTIFAETDDFWHSQGLDSKAPDLLKNLQQWIIDNHQYSDDDHFTAGNDYSSEENLLHQWVTYHILPMRIPSNRLVFHGTEYGYNKNTKDLGTPVSEYYTSFGRRRLFKLYESKESHGIFINRFPVLDNGRRGTYHELSCELRKTGCRVGVEDSTAVLSEIVNCCIYPIDAPLSYNDAVRDNLAQERIRFDAMSLFPEAENNIIRKVNYDEMEEIIVCCIPPNNVYPYFEDFWNREEDYLTYWDVIWFADFQNDEIKTIGRFDLTFRLPPVPRRGTYELRFRVFHHSTRGIIQAYFGSNRDNLPVTGIPIDISTVDNTKTGWIEDSDDIDDNADNDKRMRNLNCMKGSNYISPNNVPERLDNHVIRHIIIRQTIDPEETYYMRIKEVLDSEQKEFCLDYLEFCPKEVFDNPYTPEDIW